MAFDRSLRAGRDFCEEDPKQKVLVRNLDQMWPSNAVLGMAFQATVARQTVPATGIAVAMVEEH